MTWKTTESPYINKQLFYTLTTCRKRGHGHTFIDDNLKENKIPRNKLNQGGKGSLHQKL